MGPMPAYRDDVIRRTARIRQRPAWTLLERWIPMFDIARQPVHAPPIPWRSIGMLAVLAGLLLAVVAAIIAGSRPNVPAPFGPARTGLVAYSSGGDIYTVDAKTGAATAIVTGPETDLEPKWSRDGTRLVFERKVNGATGPGLLFAARASGSQLTLLTPEPLALLESYAFSPDGLDVLLSSNVDGIRSISIARADGSGVRTLDVGMVADEPLYRPTDGAEVSFLGLEPSLGRYGLHVMTADGTKVRTLIDPFNVAFDVVDVSWSPDGSHVAYTAIEAPWGARAVHVMTADARIDVAIEAGDDTAWAQQPVWSNDGTRLVIVRGGTRPYEGAPAIVLLGDVAGPIVDIAEPWVRDLQNATCCPRFEWAPDDSSILATPADTSGGPLQQLLWDPVSGASRPAPWSSTSDPAWQRLAQ
jgi:dipeptidyl aminopeptidase/acylaminoacyl peptidase